MSFKKVGGPTLVASRMPIALPSALPIESQSPLVKGVTRLSLADVGTESRSKEITTPSVKHFWKQCMIVGSSAEREWMVCCHRVPKDSPGTIPYNLAWKAASPLYGFGRQALPFVC